MIVYTDGSCLINPNGPGGWACLIIDNKCNNIVNHINNILIANIDRASVTNDNYQ